MLVSAEQPGIDQHFWQVFEKTCSKEMYVEPTCRLEKNSVQSAYILVSKMQAPAHQNICVLSLYTSIKDVREDNVIMLTILYNV